MMKKTGPLNKAKQIRNVTTKFPLITVGRVVDTNDPQQMGRLRVACPLLGDVGRLIMEDVPWATYMSPFAGVTTNPYRGREEIQTSGQLAYGMFNIPKVDSNVLVMCIDGDPRFRIWLGCLQEQFLTHTMPHGRYSYATENLPDGPFSSSEDKIQPLYDSQTQAFTKASSSLLNSTTGEPRKSFEFRTRGADTSVSGLGENFVNNEDSQISHLADDVDQPYVEEDGKKQTNTQGYHKTRIEPGLNSDTTGGFSYDPQVYSWTTPGFHSMSMSDAAENCRVRFRTTHGHQIIFDDTNERIYVSTAGGKAWIELDESGNIDVYAERNLSFHAEKDINFTTEKTFRVKAKEGIHLATEGDMRLHSRNTLYIKTDTDLFFQALNNMKYDTASGAMSFISNTNIDILAETGHIYANGATDVEVKAGSNMKMDAGSTTDIKASINVNIDAGTDANLKGGVNANVEGGGSANLKGGAVVNMEGSNGANVLGGGGNVLLTGAQVHLNGPPASPAMPATPANPASGTISPAPDADFKDSFWTSRVPEHEPWSRVMTNLDKADDTNNPSTPRIHEPELPYDDVNVGKKERGEVITRNKNWHR